MTSGRVLTREEAVAQSVYTETFEEGGVEYDFTLRVLSADEMLADGFVPIDATTGTDEVKGDGPAEAAKAKAALDKANEAAKTMFDAGLPDRVEKAIVRALVVPKAYMGEGTGPEGAIHVHELAKFRNRLIDSIVRHSTLTEDLARALRFRAGERHGGQSRRDVAGGGGAPAGPSLEPAAAGSGS